MTNLTKVVPDSNNQSFQQFLSDSPWKDELVIERLQQQVSQLIGDAQQGALHIDESGFAKQGAHSVGVKRQYCGRLGKVDNCQVGVFLGYTCGNNRTLIDRRLYIPEDWALDEERRKKAGVPEAVTFQTKAQLGLEMIEKAIQRGVPFGWIGMDCHYGEQPWLLEELSDLSVIYTADIPCDTRVWLECPQTEIPARKGTRGRLPRKEKIKEGEPDPTEVRQIAQQLPQSAWQRLFLRDTERKQLWCHLAALRVYPVWDGLPGPQHWLLIRRDEGQQELKYQLCNAPESTLLQRLGQMSASRYWMERTIEDAKGETGLADYQVRGWLGWHHHMTMSLLAMLFLLQLNLHWREKAQMLTVQDVREILEVILPKRKITPQEILKLIEQKHRARDSAKRSHHRKYHLRI